ncbi:hypothetical protein D9758_002578 [Tetrapyrgos nigripes]|uniref:Rho termination factor N-terminal domain-containing protein n=1 Tax=Tetrapyrgos nigripes TaxID=182062 RepID=A0A8H5GR40_9AGAR|nr:hypothetical protein D9758_002578 [Tetrapyrgos nigripes]
MSNTPENLPAGAKKRRQDLLDDPCTETVEPYAVVCKGCGGRIKLSPKSLYDGSHWRKHKTRCPKLADLPRDIPSTDQNAKKDASNGAGKAKPNADWAVPNGVLTEAELSTLNLAQLKAICKEKNLTGYSKLAKPLIIRRILDHYGSVPQASLSIAEKSSTSEEPGQSSGSLPPKLPTPPTSQSPRYNLPRQDTATSSMVIDVNNYSQAAPQASSHSATCSMLPPDPIDVGIPSTSQGSKRPSSHTTNEYVRGQVPPAKKLKAKDGSAAPPPPSKPPPSFAQGVRTKIPLTSSFARKNVPSSPAQSTGQKDVPKPKALIFANSQHDTSSVRGTPGPALLKSTLQNQATSSTSSALAAAKKPGANTRRFTPLVPKKAVPLPLIPSAVQPVKKSAEPSSAPVSTASNLSNQNHSLPPLYLDFASPPGSPSFDRLTIPPPLSKNRLILPYSIILSRVSEADIKQCMLASRVIRRAAFVSAGTRISRDFAGKRLESVIAEYPPHIYNFWPYLQQRQKELTERHERYIQSFLGKFFSRENPHIVSQRLWTSPDNERQVVIALRFLLTRLFFSISVGDETGFSWMEATVIDAQEVVEDEIWRIVVQQPSSSAPGFGEFSRGGSSQETLYVLESTCEVVGHPPPASSTGVSSTSISVPLRADWSAYIARKTSISVSSSQLAESTSTSETRQGSGLISQLSWINHEEYDKGMSRHWLKRISEEGELGRRKRMMAERYILACVVGNSVSGQWKSSTEMAQDFAGMASKGYAGGGRSVALKRSSKIHLFLPEHHLVESVHFTSRNGAPLHPALAIIQTPRREYFVLKDNGMQVGCEEDGVAEVWMDMVGCDRFGLVQ